MPTTKKKSTAKSATKKKAPAKKAPKKAVKKAAKKTTRSTAKKSTPKKATKKTGKTKASKKPLVVATDHESFWTQNGEVLNSLIALRDALAAMETEVYKFHATGDQNDFAQWVDVVLCDEECAKDLSVAKTPRSAKTVVVRHLKTYSV